MCEGRGSVGARGLGKRAPSFVGEGDVWGTIGGVYSLRSFSLRTPQINL
jgi:hypothetical protein